jgi:Na+-driven multidrug efflux pump
MTAALKATQQTSLPLRISIVVFSTNTLLCIVLINGYFGAPKLGIMGAAIATVSSRVLELALYIIVIFVRKNVLAGPLIEFFGWTKHLITRVVINSLPTAANETFWALGISMYNAAYGRIGVTEFASVQAANTIFNVVSLFCFAMGDVMLILCGEKLGQGKTEEAYQLGKRILRITLILGGIGGAIIIAASGFIVKLFAFSALGAKYTVIILIIFGAGLFIKSHNTAVVVGALRAGGDTKVGMYIDIGTVWGIGVPMAFLGALVFRLPIYYVVLLVQLDEFIKFFLMRWRFRSKIWVRDLIDET